ncbi:cAMP-binding domain of CRP or a regulatory subunit of cAMP-dependent protein kinases [Marinobacter daqiaonensis]|uniref:cAMP-binding domain of CRP or a regulatory subunit of cAMP-dependent protein kinases n=1 Tax=Marinobacter daqiaonensis TaxID=650891 RepID=A0A1I6GP76_9GAMM|nr:Crp/Fnr family transcriptional regulator [Marinobacter daqiaonensis]SFR43921.1 cAMP-binding domain of CRP or a regulatory subunit of cAMP-dependent protein kinases [Marinobacter daqiaonensis]
MTAPRNITECLVGIASLSECDRKLLQTLEPERCHYPRNSVVFRQGDPSDQLLVVESGQSFTCRYLEDGRRQIIDIHFPGDVIGLDELSQPHHLSDLTTMTDASFLHYDKAEVITLFAWSPGLSLLLFQVVSRGQALLKERMVGLTRHCALQRVAHFLLEVRLRAFRGDIPGAQITVEDRVGYDTRLKPPTVLRIPHNVIADALGLSIVHVSRILAQLREKGLIGSSGHAITLVDLNGLKTVAGWHTADLAL